MVCNMSNSAEATQQYDEILAGRESMTRRIVSVHGDWKPLTGGIKMTTDEFREMLEPEWNPPDDADLGPPPGLEDLKRLPEPEELRPAARSQGWEPEVMPDA